MSDPLYWVADLVLAITLAMILIHDRRMIHKPDREERAFRRLLVWVLYFSLQDVVWGLCSATNTIGNLPLFLASTLFHVSTVLTTFFWLDYVLTYMGDQIRHRRLFLMLDGAVIAVQGIMLVVNFFTPTIFSIRDGIYCTEYLRPLAFLNQYIVYLLIGILTLGKAIRSTGIARSKSISVFSFAIAPILTGVFQLLYPDAPFYTIGYFLGTIIIHLFIVQNKRIELQNLQHEMDNRINEIRIAEQTALSNTDQLTGLQNRRAYEEMIGRETDMQDFVYLSLDVNELKMVNDSLGHASGDELLMGAADCLRRVFEPAGNVYRIGGDEFSVMLHADGKALSALMEQMRETIAGWQGETVSRLSVSYGVAAREEFPEVSINELARIADERMYRHKSAYYLSKGIDRSGQHMAYAALCASYEKILRVNLTEDSFFIISMDESEKTPEKGYAIQISRWLSGFGNSGQVHPEDLAHYLKHTDLAYLRDYFAGGNRYLALFYRRRAGNDYKRVMLEMLPAENYTGDQQQMYLYVKNLEKPANC